MSQYLLLRDNKQSGPYTFEELTAKGLKAYDLIWIEGKSAAWRYPSEIQELKPFAPVVEEQPYDRFYKRQNSTVKKQQETVAASAISGNNVSASTKNFADSTTQNQVNAGNTTEPSQAKKPSPNTIPNRRVVVIMPGGMNKDPQRESVFFQETVENKIAQPEKKPAGSETRTPQPESYNREPVSAKKAVPTLPLYDDELVEFTKAPVGNAGSRSRQKAGKSKLPKILASTIIMLTICGIIGWAYNYNFSQRQAVTPVAIPTETVQLPETHAVFNNEPSTALENQVNTAENQLTEEEMLAAENQAAFDSVTFSAEPAVLVVKKPVSKSKKAVNENNQLPQQSHDEPVTEAVQQTRSDIAVANADSEQAEKKTARKNIGELIRVSKNDFKIGAFGGISNLELKVTNTSPYTVDLVVVEVKYLLANKKEFKTENIYFKNLAPGSTATKEAPKSTRGIQVTSKVALITSRALGMYQASL
jgi:hypothetical protein